MTESKLGRPAKYSEEQVIEGIKIVEQAGAKPTGESVKKAMCAHLGVPKGINAQSLDNEVDRLVKDMKRARDERLVAGLPEDTRHAARELADSLVAQLLVHMGEEHAHLRMVNSRTVVERDEDLANQRAQIRDLLAKQDQLVAENLDLAQRAEELQERLTQSHSERAMLATRVAELEREQDLRTQMLVVMKETLGQQIPLASSALPT